MKKIFQALALIFCSGSSAFATDAYVSPAPAQGGIGAGSACTSVAPCATIPLGSAVVTAGGTVFVSPGVYPGSFKVTKNGTLGNPITYKCTVVGACRIVPAAADTANTAFWAGDGAGASRADYNIIDGFEIDGSDYLGGTLWTGGIYMQGQASVAKRNIVHDLMRNIKCHPQGGLGIEGDAFYGGTAMVVDGNILHDLGPVNCNEVQAIYIAAPNMVVTNNIVYNAPGTCFEQWHTGYTSTIEHNTCINTAGGSIGVGEWTGIGINDIQPTVQANAGSTVLTFAANATSTAVNGWGVWVVTGSGGFPNAATIVSHTSNTVTISAVSTGTILTTDFVSFGPRSDNNIVRNNLFANGAYGLDEFGSLGSSNSYDHNLIFNNTNANIMYVGTVTNSVTSDPLFVNAGTTINGTAYGPGQDFHLQSGSPAKFAGTTITAATSATDFFGVTRPNPPSIGAIEYVAQPGTMVTGPMTIGSSVGPSAAGNPASYRLSQLAISGYGYLSNYGACLPFNNTNPGALKPQKTICVDNNGSLNFFAAQGNRLLGIADNGSVSIGNWANPHDNLGASCQSNLGLPVTGGVGIVQNCRYTLAGTTTGTTAVRLTADGNAAAANNCINMPFNSSGTYSAQLAASLVLNASTGAVLRGNDVSWTMPNGYFVQDATASTMALTNGTPVLVDVRHTAVAISGQSVALTADTTRGCFNLTFTPPSANGVNNMWSVGAYVDIIETPPQ